MFGNEWAEPSFSLSLVTLFIYFSFEHNHSTYMLSHNSSRERATETAGSKVKEKGKAEWKGWKG